jgi:hypothetical protein
MYLMYADDDDDDDDDDEEEEDLMLSYPILSCSVRSTYCPGSFWR